MYSCTSQLVELLKGSEILNPILKVPDSEEVTKKHLLVEREMRMRMMTTRNGLGGLRRSGRHI